MIFRGTDTMAILLEWIIARMVLRPDIQSKLQFEIESVVGKTRSVCDSDLPNLPYLQNCCQGNPSNAPSRPTSLLAITHNERVWFEPNEFKPKRFLEDDVAIMGSDLKLAPFGLGRRVCPGKAIGLAIVQLWLGQMLQSFKWVASDGGVDLSEVLKLSMEMKNPLVCKAVARVSSNSCFGCVAL
ncbi:Cytochrome P450 78A5 [Camellia lanceoleosa]|uniref:Cytochrome P450 78A5 n=1 Tax=Camellia lanceoleosa TaxID=1840588 RepID=A0ACC0HWK1_9ERIC|nr:Cytochrome P450 78A5 [Camellia lanceoleosa]